jgi:hypothetical protein
MRVFNHVLGDEAEEHLRTLCVVSNFDVHLHTGLHLTEDATTTRMTKWKGLERPAHPADCLVDGHWIMARTGTVEGMRLGRLKQWLHRIQVEEHLTRPEQLEAVLSRLPFEHGSPDDWPRLRFP